MKGNNYKENDGRPAENPGRPEESLKKPVVHEAIVVEGRDDAAVVERAVSAVCITTHGFGISGETWQLIDKAYREKGLIILTDPDHAGEAIRRRIGERYPDAKHAYIARDRAERAGDIGVENASPEDVAAALAAARATMKAAASPDVTAELLDQLGLIGTSGAATRRRAAAAALGISYGNGKAFLKMLQGFGITKEELINTVNGIQATKEDK